MQGKVVDFADELKKLFVQAYPNEPTTSTILLQCFLTGLRTPISRQLFLRGKPELLENTMKDVHEVEYALEFGTSGQKPMVCLLFSFSDYLASLLIEFLELPYADSSFLMAVVGVNCLHILLAR